ncbi:hypothetical protein TNIN_375711 [Trichonephila inaurata madagascariensis]|uniref:Uncharacterized protein n=1 Tax=Trichonephila inaurata madagascariensis TaxID=2747483 RepID=A0A8X6XK84_9ARAC|nr:hypothetical protein TNIN_375711 [Trichonephila inaurata madagascariensis]
MFSGSKPCNVATSAIATNTLSSYTQDYPTLPADIAEAIYRIYEDLINVKLLERGTADAYVDKEDAKRLNISEARSQWEHARRKNGSTSIPAGHIRSYRYCRRCLLWPWNR